MRSKRKICVRVNPGQPKDGTGQVCIHLVVQDEDGSFIEPHFLHSAHEEDEETVIKKLIAKPTRCRLACNPDRQAAPVTRNGETTVTPRSDDPRAVTCPKCMASVDYAEMMEILTVGRPTGKE